MQASLAIARNTVLAAFAALPDPTQMRDLMADARAAEARGYYDAVEDERLRDHYARYLAQRFALWEAIDAAGLGFKRFRGRYDHLQPEALRAFAVAYAGASIIVRSGEYLIDLAVDRDIVWQKLDEAEDRYGIPRKRFTRLFRQLTSAGRMRPYYAGRDYFDRNRDAVLAAVRDDPDLTAILTSLNMPDAARGDHLRRYGRFVRYQIRRNGWSAVRQLLFDAFESSGSAIADMRIPLVKPPQAPKRMTADQIARLRAVLRPGDVIVTRHDDALSNLFLPGFWPHSALHVGAQSGWHPDHIMLEAKKDGVLMRAVEETLQVDSCVVLRPTLAPDQVAQAVERGLTHAGKLYDFVFDFGTSDRLVCTEVVYRSFHGVGPVNFRLDHLSGRYCLSAEALLNQGIGAGWFEVVALCNVGGTAWREGGAARTGLHESFAATFAAQAPY